MHHRKSALTLIVILAGCMTVGAAQAQGLGGLINKAKDKVGKTAPSTADTPSAIGQTTGGTGLDGTGHPEHISPESMSTPARERALASAILHDPKSGTNEYHDGGAYYKLKADCNFAPAYTADDDWFTKVNNNQGRANYYIGWIDHVSEEFDGSSRSTYGEPLKQALTKIKTIHFAYAAEKVNPNDALEGWKFAWDKSTGMLTIFFGDVLQTWSYNHPLSKWTAKNVN